MSAEGGSGGEVRRHVERETRSQGQKEGKSDEGDGETDLGEKKRDGDEPGGKSARDERRGERGERSEGAPEGREREEKETALSLRKTKWGCIPGKKKKSFWEFF